MEFHVASDWHFVCGEYVTVTILSIGFCSVETKNIHCTIFNFYFEISW